MISLIFLFQNCGPAQVSGNATSADMASQGASTVGSKVDLTALLKSPQEPSSNILFPLPLATLEYDYSNFAPILETVVFKKNNFDRIEWIHGPSSTVIANGDSFTKKQFSPEMLGTYYIFGYRGQTPYLIKEFRIVQKTKPTVAVDSANAVTVTQSQVEIGATTETVLVTAEAPDVDLTKITFLLKNNNSSMSDKKAILVSKKLTESFEVAITLSDISGNSVTKIITLTAKACDFNGSLFLNGSSATAYQTSTVPYGQTCVSQSRTCNNGVLDGTYPKATCSPLPPSPCTFNGTTVAHASSVTAFETATVPYGQTCASQSRTCNNGTLSGTNQYSACSVLPGTNIMNPMAANSITIARGASFSFTLLMTRLKATPLSLLGFAHLVANGSSQSSIAIEFEPSTPSNAWVTNSSFSVSLNMTVPANLPPGSYTMRVGLYERTSPWTRYKLDAAPGVVDDGTLRYIVGTVTVQ
jgi:hypothetical protein